MTVYPATRTSLIDQGAAQVAAVLQRSTRAAADVRSARVDGSPGIVLYDADGTLRCAMACIVVDGLITEVLSVTDPERLARIEILDLE